MTAQTTTGATRRGLLLIVTASILWGTVGIATKAIYGMAQTNPLSIGFLRLALAVPALGWACWHTLGRQSLRVTRRDLGLMLMMGAMMALYQVCYFAAIVRVGVSVAVLVTLCTAPVIVALLSIIFFGERLTRHVMLALVCALVGTALLVDIQPDMMATQAQSLSGVLLALGSAFGYAILALCSRAVSGRYHPLQPITIGFTSGALMLLPFALATGLVVKYPTLGWILLLHLGLVPTALGYVLFLAGLRHTTATVASIVTLIEPLTSTALAWLLFGEQLGTWGALGAGLLISAMLLLYQSRPSEASNQAEAHEGAVSIG